MAMTSPIGITGATGEVGGRVARRLAGIGRSQRLVVRDPGRAPKLDRAEVARASYDDDESIRQALAGVGTLFFVSAHENPDRVGLHVTAIDAAVEAGVERIVYLSFMAAAPDATFTFARDHYHTEQYIKATGVAWTFLRSSLYLDYMPLFAGDEGVIRGPAGDGRVAPVARDDIADSAVAVLTAGGHDGETFDMTGPEALTLSQVADELTRASGRRVVYVDETPEEARASRSGYGAPDWEVAGWITSYAAIATGEMDIVSDAVMALSGHAPQSLADYLEANPRSLDKLRAG
jgi:NAD(P)H dehydrogenase (quinone)